ncbi:MAG: hypothetical protein WA144_11545 [Candidatus Methanoperedens sp.]
MKTTESTEDTEKNGNALCSLSALWLITYTNIPFSYRGCAEQIPPFHSCKKNPSPADNKLREVAKEDQRAQIEQEGISSGEFNMGSPMNEAGRYDWD